ncbi:hypothetical protein [Aquimarina muelleri]|uniref:Uncharacterized protein n=1 Tax=Aquimarina muelleri TaxID=279356 RepID=A0A918N1W3_9FLAO|nr:hypothetical protein [Aquimarina muelleri]MCX2761512.1 hypothetical protein [Aquimarina muelleri]GGX14262.1 hypothetical protein GCM10007384_14850 [Aquimarina muelleri]
MSTYNGIFMRSALGQTNNIPRPGALSSSPDIIPYGTEPVSDPQTFFKNNYDKDVGKTLQAQQTNYIYLRGKNFSSSKIDDSGDSRPHLFWTPASVLSYPNKWTELTQTPSRKPVSLVTEAGAVGVMSEPLIWVPDNITADHYCMIAQVPSPGYDNAIPDTLQISDFAGWVAKSGGIAWRNISVQNANVVTLTGAKMYYEQGTEAAKIQFTIICENVPIGSTVSFSAGAPGPIPPINLDPTVVSTGPSFTTGIVADVPANYVSDIYFNLQAPAGVKDLSKAKVSIQAAYPTHITSELYTLAKSPAELGMPSADEVFAILMRGLNKQKGEVLRPHHEQYLEQLTDMHAQLNSDVRSGPQRLIVVGQNNYDWK